MERPCFSSSFARAKTASAPSPVNCETRDAICPMVEFRILSFVRLSSSPWINKTAAIQKRGIGTDGRTAPKHRRLEGVAQRELDQARGAYGAGDFAEWGTRIDTAVHIRRAKDG